MTKIATASIVVSLFALAFSVSFLVLGGVPVRQFLPASVDTELPMLLLPPMLALPVLADLFSRHAFVRCVPSR